MFVLFIFLAQAAVTPAPAPGLHAAIAHGRSTTAVALVNAGADPNLRDASGRTPLHVAATADGPGQEELIRLLLARGADVNARDDSGASALDQAVWKGSAEGAALLLDGGAKLNAPETKTGATPVNEAAYQGHIGVIRLLLARGADLDIKDHAGFSPVENALREHHPEVMGILLEHHSNRDLLNHLLDEAVRRRQEDTVTILLDAGAAIDGRFASGSTALYDASLKGDNAIVSLLVSRGANVNQPEGLTLTTPLYAAAAFGRRDVVATLLLWGADPRLTGKEGITPLHAAESNSYREIAQQIRSATSRLASTATSSTPAQ